MDKLASAASTFTLQRFLTMPRSAAGSSEGRTAGSEVGARLLLASTIEVYGDSVEYLQHERNRGSVNTIGFRSCYDEGKHIAETLCFNCWQTAMAMASPIAVCLCMRQVATTTQAKTTKSSKTKCAATSTVAIRW